MSRPGGLWSIYIVVVAYICQAIFGLIWYNTYTLKKIDNIVIPDDKTN